MRATFSCAGSIAGGCDATFTVKTFGMGIEAQLPADWTIERNEETRQAMLWCPTCRPKVKA